MPESLSKLISERSAYRDLLSLIGGLCAILVLDIFFKPQLTNLPNWQEIGYIEKIVGLFFVSYFLGNILLSVAWLWRCIVLWKIDFSKINRLGVRNLYIKLKKFFDFDHRKIWRDVYEKADHNISTALVIARLHDHPGLRSEASFLRQVIYVHRILQGLLILLIFTLFISSSGPVRFSWFIFWVLFNSLIIVTVLNLRQGNAFNKFMYQCEVWLREYEEKKK